MNSTTRQTGINNISRTASLIFLCCLRYPPPHTNHFRSIQLHQYISCYIKKVNSDAMRDAANRTETGGTCPVKHGDDSTPLNNNTTAESSSNWWKRFSSSSLTSSPPISSSPSKTAFEPSQTSSTCPVSNESKGIPASFEEAARYAQTPQPDQTIFLALERQVSSIPRGSGTLNDETVKVPDHQLMDSKSDTDPKWVYPSEQQMYNAMRKKGWTNIPEESIPVVLQIHNHINERTWNQILEWENVNPSSSTTTTTASNVQLVRFQGRPNDMSPKAYIFSSLLGLYDPPFDRHDWYVQNNNSNTNTNSSSSSQTGRIQRYVIDYYYLPSRHPDMPPIPYIDARPALDHPYALYLHARRFVQLSFPGITAYLKKNGRG